MHIFQENENIFKSKSKTLIWNKDYKLIAHDSIKVTMLHNKSKAKLLVIFTPLIKLSKNSDEVIKLMELIDIRKVLEKKSPKHAARIPRFVTNWLARLIHQRELNELLIYGDGLKNVEFITTVLDKLEIKRKVYGADNISKANRPIFASNHPLGGIDGLILLEQLTANNKNRCQGDCCQ